MTDIPPTPENVAAPEMRGDPPKFDTRPPSRAGAALRGALVVGIAMLLDFKTECATGPPHGWQVVMVCVGVVSAGLVVLRGFLDSSWSDSRPVEPTQTP